jgi:hypothetical protein
MIEPNYTNQTSSFRRIVKDLKELNETYTITRVDNDYFYNPEYNTVTFNYDKKHVVIQIDDYPFKPPTIKINNIPLVYNPINFPSRLWKRYIQIYPNNCMCCKTILCPNNWSPCLKLKHALNEYTVFVEKLKIIGNILMFERIYLPMDIIREISSYLL